MISDIRVNVLLRGHRKRRRLEKLIGPGAVGYLVDLWIATAVSRPDGVLAGWTPQDVADEVGWKEDPEQLLAALKGSGWIDRKDDGTVIVHDWAVHQGWATGANDRSNRQRMKALIRHHGEEAAQRIARDKYGFNPEDYGFMPQHDSAYSTALPRQNPAHATAESGNATALPRHNPAHASVSTPSPSPSPLPSLKDSTKVLSGGKGAAGQSPKRHFTKKAGEYAETIKEKCETLKGMANGSRSFNPYQWVQFWINNNGHPQAVIDSLDGLVQFWDQVRGEPWAYIDKIMKTKNGNYHERDEQTKSKEYKKMLTELADIIGAL